MNGWRIVFYITTVMYVVAGSAYLLFGTADVQPWNNVTVPEKTAEQETTDDSEQAAPEHPDRNVYIVETIN